MAPMVTSVTSTVRLRAVAVWLTVTGGTAGIGMLLGPTLLAGPGHTFVEVLTWGCSAAGVVAGTVTWWVVTDVVRALLAGSRGAGTVGPLRALVLVACGVAAFSSPATAQSPAGPDATGERHVLAGLPLPDRPTTDRGAAALPHPARAVTVRPGDTLWALAHDQLGPGASDGAIADHVRTLHRRNAAVIGPDPDLILPGQRLQLPPTPRRDHP